MIRMSMSSVSEFFFVAGMRLFPPERASHVNVIVLVRRHAFCGSDEKFTNVVMMVWRTFVIFVAR